ncbi:MAG: hypothetical protein ACFFER_09155 [Candidatus Thorarchaeota archaeon]
MTNRIEIRIIAIMLLAMLTATFSSPLPVETTTPERIVLIYNEDTHTLFVNVTHPVQNTKNHYIELIEIFKNSVFQFNRTYSEQVFNYGLNDTFAISAASGDNLTVTVTCFKGYSLSKWIIVGGPTTTNGTSSTPTQTETETTTPPPQPMPFDPSIAVGVGFVGAVVFIIAFVMYKEGYITQIAQKVRP